MWGILIFITILWLITISKELITIGIILTGLLTGNVLIILFGIIVYIILTFIYTKGDSNE